MHERKLLEKIFKLQIVGRRFISSSAITTSSKYAKSAPHIKVLGRNFNQKFSSQSLTQNVESAGVSLQMKNVFCNKNDSMLEIEWSSSANEEKHSYPFVWLRDNCQCEKCFDPSSLSRTLLFEDLDLGVSPLQTKLSEDGSQIMIDWSDGHCSSFSATWLHSRSFPPNESKARLPHYKLKRIFWGGELAKRMPTADFNEILNNDEALLNWLQQLEVFGYVLIQNAPASYGQLRKLVDRVGFIRKTHYGTDFSVKAKPSPSNVAYSTGPLQLHTDLPYYYYKPGAQLIHCIIQYEGAGGESLVSDAVHVAHQLRNENKEMFDLLCNIQIDWTDTGSEEGLNFFKVLQQPVIKLDKNGAVERINFSHPQRDSFLMVKPPIAIKWYAALKTYHKMLYDPKYSLRFKMTPGTMQSFDNLRIVHGRTSYKSGDGVREIEGCYIDWDEVRSRRRVLERDLNISSSHLC